MSKPEREESAFDLYRQEKRSDSGPAGVSLRAFVAALGVVMIVFGATFGFWQVKSDSGYWASECGSAFSSKYVSDIGWAMEGSVGTSPSQQCADKLGTRVVVAWVFIGAGLVLSAGAAFVRTPVRPTS